ncbi:MAG: ferredoxin FdxA [Myxococcota bacterium]
MAFVVTEPCVKCKFTDCVNVCPVDCFREGVNFLVIDPEECIDCGACVPECPVEAIYLDEDVPERWQEYIPLNAHLSEKWPSIQSGHGALDEADDFRDVALKRHLLSMTAAD